VPAKLILINNCMKDLVGHYYETAISVADAARAKGLIPILATHVDCPTNIIPDWLDSYPIFCIHHWLGDHPPCTPPAIRGHRADPYSQKNCMIAAVRSGQMSVEDYIRAYIELPEGQPGVDETLSAQSLRNPMERPLVEETKRMLDMVGCGDDLEHALMFKRDLERLLSLTGYNSEDHVYLATAHARDLLGVALFVCRAGSERAPTFHLEYRHSLFDGPNWQIDANSEYLRMHRAYFAGYRNCGLSPRIRFYTDTEELAEEFRFVAGFDFSVLPIPFRSHGFVKKPKDPAQPLCFSYFGEARDEKGFHWLADTVDQLMDQYIKPGKLRFMLQATVGQTGTKQPQSVASIARLLQHPRKYVKLVGLEGPLSAEGYSEMVTESDAVLCPYHAYRYRNSSSGTLMEAIVAAKPTIVPSTGWLSRQQPPGSGGRFVDQASFIDAVKQLCDQFQSYKRVAERYSSLFRLTHSPERLLAKLLQKETSPPTMTFAQRIAA